MRGNDLVFAFPALLIAIMITAVFGPSALNAIIAIGIFNMPVFARLTRGAALSLWTRDFVLAARVAGKGPARISVEHILPNLTNLLIVQGTIQFSLGILAEAGALLCRARRAAADAVLGPDAGREPDDDRASRRMLALVPGLAIVLTVLGLNLMGDGLRDLLDPRTRRARALSRCREGARAPTSSRAAGPPRRYCSARAPSPTRSDAQVAGPGRVTDLDRCAVGGVGAQPVALGGDLIDLLHRRSDTGEAGEDQPAVALGLGLKRREECLGQLALGREHLGHRRLAPLHQRPQT